jgi:YjbE family integral membrane protein
MSELVALFQVILIDLALAGDNAIAVGLAASALPRERQRRAIFWGVLLALVLRIGFSLLAVVGFHNVPGLLLVGGLLLIWIAYRMWRDLRRHQAPGAEAAAASLRPPKSFLVALFTIVVADVSMSLDNVLAVAGVALDHPFIMAFGLVLSVMLTGIAATIIARVINRFPWLAIIGIAIILFAAVRMIWHDLYCLTNGALAPIPAWLGGGSDCNHMTLPEWLKQS